MISASSLICEAREPLTTFVRAVSPEVKVQKVALYALSAASGLSSCVSLLAPALSAASLWTAGLFVPLAGFSLVTAFVARLLKDYDNPIDLYQMRQEAKQMSYESLIYEHGSLNPINAHEIVDPFSLQKKFEKSCEGKPLSKILDKTPLTQILSASLLSQKTLRRLCIAELYQLSCIDQLFERVDGIDWYELSRYGAISSKELETLEKLHSTFKKVDLDYRSKLFELHTECMGRRSFVLLDLEQREKKAQEDLSYGYGQTRRGSLAGRLVSIGLVNFSSPFILSSHFRWLIVIYPSREHHINFFLTKSLIL